MKVPADPGEYREQEARLRRVLRFTWRDSKRDAAAFGLAAFWFAIWCSTIFIILKAVSLLDG